MVGANTKLGCCIHETDIPRAPSYFSNYFEEQIKLEENGGGAIKTLFIDRDPDTFADICRHLQGTSRTFHFT